MLINTSHGDPPVSFHAHHEAPRLVLSRKSPPCPSQANHASAFSSCWHGLMQQEVYRASYVSVSLPSSLTLQPRPAGLGKGKETVAGKASLNTPQATMLTTIAFLLCVQSGAEWSVAVGQTRPPFSVSQRRLLWVQLRAPVANAHTTGKVSFNIQFHGDTVLTSQSQETDEFRLDTNILDHCSPKWRANSKRCTQ